MTRRRKTNQALAQQTLDTGMAVPPVMGHRLTRLALASWPPNPRDRREFKRMGDEKMQAFPESWQAMGRSGLGWTSGFLQQWLQCLWTPWWLLQPQRLSDSAPWLRQATHILGRGAEPVRRRAVANARRLARTPLR